MAFGLILGTVFSALFRFFAFGEQREVPARGCMCELTRSHRASLLAMDSFQTRVKAFS